MRAGNGYQPDLHAFEITPQGTALFTVYDAIRCNLSRLRRPRRRRGCRHAVPGNRPEDRSRPLRVARARPRRARRLLHAGQARRHARSRRGTTSISTRSQNTGTDLLVDSRNTWAAYDVTLAPARSPGASAASSRAFKMGRARSPAWQHDARAEPDGTDLVLRQRRHAEGALPVARDRARAEPAHHDRLARLELRASQTPLLAASQGDFQPLTRRQLVRRLGSGTVLLGIHRRRRSLARCPPPRPLPVVHRAEVPLDRRPRQSRLGLRSGPAPTAASMPTPAGTAPPP